MIYAQRPDATACAEWDFWNQKMRRYIRRGSQGIALIDTSRGRPVLRYVFDVSDTGRMDNGLNPNLWQYREEHRDVVAAALESRFEVPGGQGLPEQLENIAAHLAEEYWNNHRYDLLRIVDGSFLEGYDEFNTGAAFRSAAAVSITYSLMSRCGLELEDHFRHEDFMSVFDFNTRDAVIELGTAVSQSSEQVLRQIEVTIKRYEREKIAERSVSHDQQLNLHPSGGLSDSRSGPAGAAGERPGQVRGDAPAVLEGVPSGAVQPPLPQRDPVQPPPGDRGRGQQPLGDHDAPAGEGGGSHGAAESQRSDDVGGPDEQLQSPGGGDHFVGAGLQLSFLPPEIPSQQEQVSAIQKAESADAPSAFSLSQADVDRALREPTQSDIDVAIQEWNGDISSKQRVQQHMTAHAREKGTAAWLKKEYGDNFPAYPVHGRDGRTGTDLSWPKLQRHLARLVKEGRFFTEAELDNVKDVDAAAVTKQLIASGTIPDPEQEVPPKPAPTVREIYEHYKPIVRELVLADVPYQNACKNSDREDAVLEGNAAVKRAATTIMGPDFNLTPDFMRLYFDMAEFRRRLHKEIVDETYPVLSAQKPDIGSPTPDFQEREAQLPYKASDTPFIYCEWSESDIFEGGKSYAVFDFDRLMKQADDEYAANKKAALEKYGTWQKWFDAKDPEFSRFLGYDKVKFTVVLPDGRTFTERQDIGDGDGGLLDFLSQYDKYHDVLPILRQAAELERAGRGMTEQSASGPQTTDGIIPAEVPPSQESSGQSISRDAADDVLNRGQVVVPGTAAQPARDPLAPAYKVGDTVYLNDTAFEITNIGLSDVELRDPALPIPLLRAENTLNFERLLRKDSRNGPITSYLPADMSHVNDDFREVLTSHLLTDRDKDYISMWIRSGTNNRGMAMRLSETFASRAETVTLETGDIADYFTSTISMAVEIQDKFRTKLSLSWDEIAPILRAMYQQELDGFTHEPVQRESVELKGTLSYQVGDEVAFAYGDHDVSGTIEGIGDLDVIIHTGPYVWSHQTVTKDFFEHAVRHDERNAALFTPEAPAAEAHSQPAPPQAEQTEAPPPASVAAAATEPATVYPGDRNGLPYDVVVQKLRFDEPEQTSPEAVPAAGNFRITDDNLGVGGSKQKFRMNVEAIRTLQRIEAEGRTATPAEQEILSRYVGWGGIPDVFDPDKEAWSAAYQELADLLSEEEYKSARASTLNAHFTSPTVINAIYEAAGNMGFQSGNILEPACGVGNFFGLLPEAMAASKLYGVELDSITGRIAQQLYPQANVAVCGFEKASFPRDFFDLAVGNVPFGQYTVNDREYNKLGFHIHNFFFAKTLDRVRPGGVIAFITSRYTLDAKDTSVRQYLAERADLLGAIRLPNNAFKDNAGTKVVSDIIFLQKRDTPSVEKPAWVQTGENADGFRINRYFIDHPEMILGRQTAKSTQYSNQDFTVEPIQGLQLADQLHDAVKYIHGKYREAVPPELDDGMGQTETGSIPADPSVKNYSFAITDGEIYYRENSIMVKPALNVSARKRVIAMVGLRDCVRELIDLQMDEYTPDSAIREKQGELDRLYNAFSKKFGLINNRANRLAFDRDSSYYLLCSLEVLDETGRLERKADMFTKRTIKQNTRVTRVNTATEALAVSIGERAKVDMPFMAQLCGKSEAELERDLTGVIFRDIRYAENAGLIPKAFIDVDRFPLVTADEYLSGNVRKKLRMAQALYHVMSPEQQVRIKPNVDALTAAQPKDLDASEIEVRLGTDWIDKKYIQQFMYETLKTPGNLRKKILVMHSQHSKEWAISCKNSVSSDDVAAYITYGTERASAYRILEDSLNLRDVRIYDTISDPDGTEHRVLNAKETTLAAQKQQVLREAFRDWIWKDPQRRQTLVKQYNEEMNCIRPREYDGSHITFFGINPEIKLKPHQVNAIAHILYGGNTLLAHEVGAGKTFEMIAAAMESKRLGLCHKSMFVVPNHLTGQTASEFLRLYPAANILVTTERDFETRKRKKFCARIATGDYDAVIIGHSQFEKIPVSIERQKQLIQEQIMEISAGIQELKYSGGERFSIKQQEGIKRKLEANLEKLQARHRKDDVVTFEQLGVDMMFVDESDNYKNLFLYTKMRNVAGLAATDAQKSSDMFAKCRYLDEITKNRGVIFATGTPVYTL